MGQADGGVDGRPAVDIGERSTVREVLTAWPEAEAIFDRQGLVGCGGPNGPLEPIGFFARVHQVDPDALIRELNAFIADPVTGRSGPAAATVVHGPDVYPPFLVASLALALGAGLLLGLAALWQMTLGLGLSVDWAALVEAHGNLQVFGFVVLFVAGVALHVVPRFRGTALRGRGAALAIVPLVGGGALVRAIGQIGAIPALVVASAVLEAAGIAILASILLRVLDARVPRLASAEPRPARLREAWEPWVLWGIGWLLVAAAANLVLALGLAGSGSAWTPTGLEDPFLVVAFLGFAASFVLGVGLRTLPVFMGLRATRYPLAERALRWWQAGVVVMAAGGFGVGLLRLPASGTLRSAAEVPSLAAALLLLAALGWFVRATGAWERAPRADEQRHLPGEFRWFVRVGLAWLGVALLLVAVAETEAVVTGSLPVFTRVQAARHALALGFVTQVMLGMASRIVPVFRGRPLRWAPVLWIGFATLNLGALLRVLPEFIGGYVPPTDPLLAASGAFAFTGIAACAVVLLRTATGPNVAPARQVIRLGSRPPARHAAVTDAAVVPATPAVPAVVPPTPAVPAARATPEAASAPEAVPPAPAVPVARATAEAASAPAAVPPAPPAMPAASAAVAGLPSVDDIGPHSNIGWLLETWPAALDVLLELGFAPLADPALRARLAPTIDVAGAAAIHGRTPEALAAHLRSALAMAGDHGRPQAPAPRTLDVPAAETEQAPGAEASRPASDGRRVLALAALRTVLDPEIPINVVDLGLLRGLSLDGARARITMTLTFPGCPSGPYLEAEIADALGQVPGVEDVEIDFDFEPPWSFDQMTPAGRAALGVA